jgi:hypothetical protein
MKQPLKLENKSLNKEKVVIYYTWLSKDNLIAIKILKVNKHSLKHTLQEMLLEN